jgi:hypothetical protein
MSNQLPVMNRIMQNRLCSPRYDSESIGEFWEMVEKVTEALTPEDLVKSFRRVRYFETLIPAP